jgi:4-hydroxybenzoate polyprenyltransferase
VRAGSLRALLTTAHPGPSLLISAIIVALAAEGSGAADSTRLIGFAVATIAGEFSIGWSNDYFDATHDAAVSRQDKPVASGQIDRATTGRAATVALLVGVAGCFALSPRTGVVNLVMMAAGWAYNAGLKRTAWSGLTYLIGFGLIPVFALTRWPGQPVPPAWIVVAAALIGLGGHFANVLPDLDSDRIGAIRGLPQRVAASRLGPMGVRIAATVLLLASSLVLAVAIGAHHPPVAIAALGVTAAASAVAVAGRGRAPFVAVMVLAAIDVALVLASRDALV